MLTTSCFSISMAVATSSFAYYGDYSSPSFELPGCLTFMCIIMIAWGILEIILFFKIWGMTNDVQALKKDHFCETTFETMGQMARYLRKNLVLGNMDNVKRILLQNFIDNMEHGYGELKTYGYVKDENGNVHIPVLLLEQMQEVGRDFRRFGLLKGKRKTQYAAMSGKPHRHPSVSASRSLCLYTVAVSNGFSHISAFCLGQHFLLLSDEASSQERCQQGGRESSPIHKSLPHVSAD